MAAASSTDVANSGVAKSEIDAPLASRRSLTREQIVAETRSWIGTPYRHQASVKGVGCDCLGLVRGVWRALYGSEAEAVPAYSSDWGQATGEETMLLAARRHLVEVDRDRLEPGNVVVFRMHGRAIAKHAGILTGKGRFAHAYQPMRVTENWLDGWWGKRIAAVFEFPGVSLRPTPSPSPDPSPDRSDLGGGGKR
jgi:NlpC/P60 family putative phage cell wall peptidase